MRAQLDLVLGQEIGGAISELGNTVLPVLSIQNHQCLSERKKALFLPLMQSHSLMHLTWFGQPPGN